MPFVFLLGNHSSGKSSFINFLLGRAVQTTGVAPTDDSFTIIMPGATQRLRTHAQRGCWQARPIQTATGRHW